MRLAPSNFIYCYLILVPHSGQNFADVGTFAPHSGQKEPCLVANFSPHSKQNFAVVLLFDPHLGQIFPLD